MDLVIPLLEATTNDYLELRYALRGFEKFLTHDRIVIIGMGLPSWMDAKNPNILWVPYRDDPNPRYREANIFLKVNHYVRRISDGESDFILVNDDYFLLKEWNPFPPYPNKGTLRECIRTRSQFDPYKSTISNTIKILGDQALNLDVHAPMAMHPDIFQKVFGKYESREEQAQNPISWKTEYGFLFKSLYGQRFPDSYRSEDAKFNTAEELNDSGVLYTEISPSYFSINDPALTDETAIIFERLYQEPSRYES